MTDVAVSNSTCLIALGRINRIDILRHAFGVVFVPPEVEREIGQLPHWVSVRPVAGTHLLHVLRSQLGPGEAAAIALAPEIEGSVLILDDYKARRLAQQMSIPMIGTIGLLVRAKLHGRLDQLSPVLDDLDEAGFHMSGALKERALKLAMEGP